MDNVFQIGGTVSGDSFIGRKALVEKYKKDYLESNNRVGRSIVGLTRIGKTSFSNMVFSDVPDDILLIQHDLKLSDSYYALWKKICIKISKFIRKNGISSNYLEMLLEDIKSSDDIEWVEFEENIVDIFDELNNLGIRSIVVLDEFDYAEDLFEGKTHYFELFRTLFADHKVSSMLLSRRQLHMIEKTTYQSSTFHGILEPIYLLGFDEDDMSDYYKVFEDGGVQLTEEQKDEIEYYAGRAPFLLSIMGYYIVECNNDGGIIDIPYIFKEKCKAINDYYRDCIQHLIRDDDINRIVPFVIGPNVGVTQNDRDELINIGYLREQGTEWVAISDYFVSFLSTEVLDLDIWDNIISLEKKIKLIIEGETLQLIDRFSAGGTSVPMVQRHILEQIEGVSKHLSLLDHFIEDTRKQFNIESNYFEAMSLKDSFKIVKECWPDIFSKYFGNDMYAAWDAKFEKCGKARNPVAHGHEEYLTPLDQNEVDTYCKQMFETFSKSNIASNSPNDEEILARASRYPDVDSILAGKTYEEPDESLVGEEVDMLITELGGKPRRNLRGIVNDRYKAVIPKSFLTEKNLEELSGMVGTTIRCKISKICGDRYEIIYEE